MSCHFPSIPTPRFPCFIHSLLPRAAFGVPRRDVPKSLKRTPASRIAACAAAAVNGPR
jgi:hypothetical protein